MSCLTLKAIAIKDGMTDSEITQAEYTIERPAELSGKIKVATNSWKNFLNKLTFGLFFQDTQEVIIEESNAIGSIKVEYFTTSEDFSEDEVKAKNDGWLLYSGPFTLTPDANVVVYARISDNTKTIYLRSDRIILDKTAPAFSLEDGTTYDGAQILTVSDNYALASVLLGDEEQLPKDYTGKETTITLSVDGTYTITAKDKSTNQASITVTIAGCAMEQVDTPVFSPDGGTYDSPQSVEINCATDGAEIYYTTDGSDPTFGSTKYTGAIGVSETTTIKAIAVKDGMTGSAVAEATYTIQITPAHSHSWAEEWTDDDSYHWHECTAGDCPIAENSEKDGYGAHTESEWITTQQPTETEAGSKKKECTVCKRELATEEIPPTGFEHTHALTQIPAKEATCVQAGHTEYYYCEGCGKYFSDSEGTKEIQLSDTVISATGIHTAADDWQYDGENHWKRCSVCNQQVEKTAHSGGTANCHQKAACETCGAEYGSLNPENHDGETEVKGQKDATETEDGYTGDTYCLGCDKLLKQGEVIPKLEPGHTHEFGGDWQSDSTHHWQICTAGDGEVGSKAAHTASDWIDDKNLLENELSKRHQECTVCGYAMATVIIVKADGIVEVKPGKDSSWKFYGAFKDLIAIRLNGVAMGAVDAGCFYKRRRHVDLSENPL